MGFNYEKVEYNLNEYQELTKQLKELKQNYSYLANLKKEDEYVKIIEETDKEMSTIKEKLDAEINNKTVEELEKIKKEYETLKEKSEILFEAWEIKTKLDELETTIVTSVMQPAVAKKNEDIHSLLNKAEDMEELKLFIDAICISFYKVPLLVALISKDPEEIEEDFQLSDIPKPKKDRIIEYIIEKKTEISENLILSDRALIDLIENVTGKNITFQQKHNEINPTDFNDRFKGQLLIERGDDYTLLKNQFDEKRSTNNGTPIKRFSKPFDRQQFTRRDSDMLVRNYPGVELEDLAFRSFQSLDNNKKSMVIAAVMSNLKLCYEMFESYYLSDKIEFPILVNLTNGKTLKYGLGMNNLSHLLGIPPTLDNDGLLQLPPATIVKLGLRVGDNALTVLEKMIEEEDRIISDCGLYQDPTSKLYYEMFPWEKIILKTNAFIRGDFFTSTSLVTPINPKSFLISAEDEISKISVTPTLFGQTALNHKLIDSSVSFEEAVKILKKRNSQSDFIFKGMTFDKSKKLWVPKTNESAMGERIIPYKESTLKTLEKYRYLLSGIPEPSDGGFVTSVTTGDGRIAKEYSATEMLTALVDIANSFATTKEIENNLRGYLEQIQDKLSEEKEESRSPKK